MNELTELNKKIAEIKGLDVEVLGSEQSLSLMGERDGQRYGLYPIDYSTPELNHGLVVELLYKGWWVREIPTGEYLWISVGASISEYSIKDKDFSIATMKAYVEAHSE